MKKIFIGIAACAVVAIAIIWVPSDLLTTSIFSSSKPQMITLHTNVGDIKVKLFRGEAPKTAENFYQLAMNGKYNDTAFHRVIKGFIIQGGDFENGDGTGGHALGGGLLKDEISDNLSHVRGAISMANRGPDTNGSQFFIVHEDAIFLDGRHTIFGQVVSNMSVIDRIARVRTDLSDRPVEPIVIQSVSSQ